MTDPSDTRDIEDQILNGGSDFDGEEDLYVNFSDEEASTTPRDIEPLPSGKYLCTIEEVEMRYSQSEKHNGKPYYAIKFNVIGDKKGNVYVGRKCWTNAMLFPPALYTIQLIMKAIGFSEAGKSGRTRVPRISELIDQTIVVAGVYVGETKDKKDPSKVYQPKFEPKTFFAPSAWNKAGAAGAASGKVASASDAASLLS